MSKPTKQAKPKQPPKQPDPPSPAATLRKIAAGQVRPARPPEPVAPEKPLLKSKRLLGLTAAFAISTIAKRAAEDKLKASSELLVEAASPLVKKAWGEANALLPSADLGGGAWTDQDTGTEIVLVDGQVQMIAALITREIEVGSNAEKLLTGLAGKECPEVYKLSLELEADDPRLKEVVNVIEAGNIGFDLRIVRRPPDRERARQLFSGDSEGKRTLDVLNAAGAVGISIFPRLIKT